MRLERDNVVVIVFLCFLFSFFEADGREAGVNRLSQKEIWTIDQLGVDELNEGLAGSYSGFVDDYFLYAGGSHFPEAKPWENGSKAFSDLVVVLKRDNNEFSLVYKDFLLPDPIGEGASVAVPGGLMVIGGETPDGLSPAVLKLSYSEEKVQIEEYPSLPFALKNSSASVIGSHLYVAGGENDDGFSDKLLRMDLSNPDRGWESLSNLPGPLSGAAMASQQDGDEISLYLFGGRAKEDDNLLTTFYSTVYKYIPSNDRWVQKSDILLDEDNPLPLAMAQAVPVGATHVLLVGGDDGTIFNKVEKSLLEISVGNKEAVNKRDSLWINHAGFSDKILIYNTVTDVWFTLDSYKFSPVAVFTASAVGNSVIIAGGEERPGIRSSGFVELSLGMEAQFGLINYVVLGLYFGAMLLLGFWFHKKDGGTNDFFKAGGRIPWWAAGISIFATTLSAITFIAIPGKTYATDWRMLVFNLSIFLVAPVVIRYYLPFFRRLNYDTAYEYLEARFNRIVRYFASSLFVFFMVSRIAIVLFLPSLALFAVTGFNIYFAIIIMGVVTIIYCTSGGIEAVVWGDVIQGFILLGGAIFALIFMITGVEGGFSTFWTASLENNKFHAFDFAFDFSQPVLWVVLFGGLANALITYSSDQSVVQRYMTTKDEKATSRSIWLNGILTIPVTILFFLLGTGLYAFYKSNPASLVATNPNIDSVFPQFIVSELPVGFAGLLIAAVFAAAMSTLSSNINSVSAVITSDFYKTLHKGSTEKMRMGVAKWSGIIVGVLGIFMALVLATWNIASLWDQFNTFLGLLTSGLGALFFIGIFFPRVGAISALIGLAGGLTSLVIIKNSSDLSFIMYGLAGMGISVVLSLIASLVFPNKKNITGKTWKTVE
ncbi:sodium/solute symporter [Marinilabiliaceae bacterium ANBcel2]|nr:sodium/solute symporter [Marinilabiliaceae bacterium ANBcel2]